jgi:hypothetical protein
MRTAPGRTPASRRTRPASPALRTRVPTRSTSPRCRCWRPRCPAFPDFPPPRSRQGCAATDHRTSRTDRWRRGQMTGRSGTTAGELVARARGELVETAEAIRSHRFLERLRSREVADERLRALAGEQHAIVSSDRRSFAVLAARFPSGLAGEFFLGMAEGEGAALDKLRGLADWLGMTDEELHATTSRIRARRPTRRSSPGSRSTARARTSSSPFSPTLPPGARTAARSQPRCARPTGRGRTRWRSSTSSPVRPRTSRPARCRSWTRDSRRATRRPWLAARPGCCRPTNCPSGMRSRKGYEGGLSGTLPAATRDRSGRTSTPPLVRTGRTSTPPLVRTGTCYGTFDRQRCRVGIRQGHLLLINYSRLTAEHVTSRAELR